jgi:MFS superfamily sulfate permease-like transporter
VGLLSAAGALVVLFFGGALLGYIPQPVVGGLLLF